MAVVLPGSPVRRSASARLMRASLHVATGRPRVDVPAARLVLARGPHRGQAGGQARATGLDQRGPLLEEVEELDVDDEEVAGDLAADDGQAGRPGAVEPGDQVLLGRQRGLVPLPTGKVGRRGAVAPNRDNRQAGVTVATAVP